MSERDDLREVVESQVGLGHKFTIVPTDVLVRILAAPAGLREAAEAVVDANWSESPNAKVALVTAIFNLRAALEAAPRSPEPLDVDMLRTAARRVPLPHDVTVADIEDLAREYEKERLAQALRRGETR